MISDKLGASQSVIQEDPWEWPLHGLRHPPELGTNGWYLWTGDSRQDHDFFLPWHLGHVVERCPELLELLQSLPGTRFVYAPDYLDVRQDETLLKL